MKIDKDKCIGCGSCEAVAPSLFGLKDGKAFVKKQPETKEEKKKYEEAKENCPVGAIS